MDPLRLLSRSTRLSKGSRKGDSHTTPSSGQQAQPQLFPNSNDSQTSIPSRKRKRVQASSVDADASLGSMTSSNSANGNAENDRRDMNGTSKATNMWQTPVDQLDEATVLSLDERKHLLKQHKLKVAWLNPVLKKRRDGRKVEKKSTKEKAKPALFPQPVQRFEDLAGRFDLVSTVAANIAKQAYTVPTEVQLGALPILLDSPAKTLSQVEGAENADASVSHGVDLLTVAPTGSGKTLAFMIPLVHHTISDRRTDEGTERHTTALILAPTRELASQIVNEGRKLTQNTGVKVTQMRKGMHFGNSAVAAEDNDGKGTNGQGGDEGASEPVVKADILVSTPGLLAGVVQEVRNADALSRVNQLILDEADVLLDPLFREQTLAIWHSLTNPDLRVSMWSATMGSNIEELVCSTMADRRERLASGKVEKLVEPPLVRLVVGLKDSAVPNVEHKLVYAASEQGKLMGLRQLLHPTASSVDSGPPLLPPFLVFTQTIERAIALHSELLYDIPAEAGGINRIAVLHSDLTDTVRDNVMTRFRRGEIWILITTDLLSRGVDFRGVNGVVNYDIPTSSAAYVHRVGRTGRAGREGGVAVTLYSKEDVPYLKHVVNVVNAAQKEKGGQSGAESWLLDALPTLSKKQKQQLKKRGVESRTAKGKKTDPKSARRARISTKAGYVRREENNRKGAIAGSKRRMQAELSGSPSDESDFGGFD